MAGNRRVGADDIRARFRGGPDHRLDAAAIDAGIKALYATGLFTDVRVERVGGRLALTVTEAPVIDRIAFEGNSSLKDKQLAAVVESKAHGPLSRPVVQGDVSRILELYRHAGHYEARVEPKTIDHDAERLDLVFEIREGPKTTVQAVTFRGNRAFADWRLKSVLKTREKWLLSFLTSSDLYDADKVEEDRALLQRFYVNHGYADAQVTADPAAYDPARKGFAVAFTIDEGPLFRFGRLDVQSRIPAVDAVPLQRVLRMRSGDVYSADAVEKSGDDLVTSVTKGGYPFATVRPRTVREGETINVVYSLDEGPRRYVERINIRHNGYTRDHVIRREFDLAEGDAYNKNLLDRAERRLKRLGFFKSVKITTEPGSTSDRVVVNVDVEEDKTADFFISGGYSSADGMIGQVSVSDKNLFGLGAAGKISVTYGQYTKAGELGFTQPYVFGTRASLGVDVFGRETDVSSYQSYGSEVYGTTVRLAAPVTDMVSAEARYTISDQRTSLDPALMDCSPANPPPLCYLNGEASVPIKEAALAGPSWVSLIGYTLSASTIDNPLSPTSGFRNDLRQDVAGVGGDVRFLRTTDEARYYQPITDDLTAIAHMQGGTISGWGGQAVPLTNSFFGGPQLVRGFAPNGFGPRDLTPGTTMDNVGGTRYWAASAELQAPIPWLPPDVPLKGAVFADAGSVFGYGMPALSSSFALADQPAVRSSIGAGLIWASPFGPLRVDYAFPTSKTSYDVTQRLHFGAGPF